MAAAAYWKPWAFDAKKYPSVKWRDYKVFGGIDMKPIVLAAIISGVFSSEAMALTVLNPGNDRFYVDTYIGEGAMNCYGIRVIPGADYLFGFSNGTPSYAPVIALALDANYMPVDVGGSVPLHGGTPFTTRTINSPVEMFTMCVGGGGYGSTYLFAILIDTEARAISIALGEPIAN
jgi:hypothetical protein